MQLNIGAIDAQRIEGMNKMTFAYYSRGTVLAAVLACSACGEEVRSAQWWMGHGPELQAKLIECKNNPASEKDDNCRNATEAFVTLVSATAQKNGASAPAAPGQQPSTNP
ncbi:MAG: EexN family lipoprotein [Dokdonella sp.]